MVFFFIQDILFQIPSIWSHWRIWQWKKCICVFCWVDKIHVYYS